MVDTWATVGSCAQIGADVHLAGGVGIGGVLEPVQARPVIVEDGAFIGSRCIVTEGVRRRRAAPCSAPNVVADRVRADHRRDRRRSRSSTAATCRRARSSSRARGRRSSRPGTYQLACALIIGRRSESTDLKTSLNDALRELRASAR